jgi:hypothetical protein
VSRYSPDDSTINFLAFLTFSALMAMCFYPEVSLAAATMEQISIDVEQTAGMVGKVAIGAAVLLGGAYGVFTGNGKLILGILGCTAGVGIGKAFVGNGMVLLN